MIPSYPHVSEVGIKWNGITDGLADGILKNLEIMLAAFCLLRIDYLKAVTFHYNLRFYRVAFFLPE